MYVRVTNGQPEIYTIGQLRRDNPQVSFPRDIPNALLASYDVYPVTQAAVPDHDALTQTVAASTPALVDGVWTQDWTVTSRPDAADRVRGRRTSLLSETDYMALSDSTLTPEWAAYRQALRDVPEQPGFPFSVVWPSKPA